MKIFGWMKNKLNGRHDNHKPNSFSVNYHTRQESRKEEFSDWPHELLAIGTFGNNYIKQDSKHDHLQENPSSSRNHPQEPSPEEVKKLRNELSILLNRQDGSTSEAELDKATLALDEFLSGQTSFCSESDESNNRDCCPQGSTNLVPGRTKDIHADNTGRAINKKSLSFLLKKMFVCRSGFTPTLSLRDQVPESRMEKIFRATLHKRIYPQNPSPPPSTKKYLENKQRPSSANEKPDDGSKWVKTDSEYIVLEI